MHFLYLLRKRFILELNGEKVELLVKVRDLKIMKNKANYKILRDT